MLQSARKRVRTFLTQLLHKRRLHAILSSRRLRIDGPPLKPSKVYRVTDGTGAYVLKITNYCAIHFLAEWLPRVKSLLQAHLVVPRLVAYGEFLRGAQWALMEWIEGTSLAPIYADDAPSSTAWGGRLVDARHIAQFMHALHVLTANPVPRTLFSDPKPAAYFLSAAKLRSRVDTYARLLLARAIISERDYAQIRTVCQPVLNCDDRGPVYFTNGDFQFRNFIVTCDNRIAIVDWDGARFSSFEREHAITYQCVLLFGNTAARQRLLQEAQARFSLQSDIMRAYFTVNCLGRIVSYLDHPHVREQYTTLLPRLITERRWQDVLFIPSRD